MELKDIVAISGLAGLHKVVGRSKNGLIVETIGNGRRFATSFQHKVSVLEDISMYTTEGDLRLAEVFVKIKNAGNLPAENAKSDEIRKYLINTISLDSERVYDSDIKKLFNWYNALVNVLDFDKLLSPEQTSEPAEETITENAEDAAPKAEAKKTSRKTKTEKASDDAEKPKAKTTRKKKSEE